MTQTSSKPTSDKPFTLDDLLDAKHKLDALGPPPPEVRFSKHAPVFGDAKPSATAHTDDMREMVEMVESLGPQKVPMAFRLRSQFGDMLVVNPVNVKGKL